MLRYIEFVIRFLYYIRNNYPACSSAVFYCRINYLLCGIGQKLIRCGIVTLNDVEHVYCVLINGGLVYLTYLQSAKDFV